MNQGEYVMIEEVDDEGQVITPLSTLEPSVQRRVLFLKEFQEQYDNQEKEYEKELKALEQKYTAIYDKIYAKRAEVVQGTLEAPEHIQVEDKKTGEGAKGIPSFWLTAIANSNDLADMIHEEDENALEYLVDIRVEEIYPSEEEEKDPEDEAAGEEGFKLIFEFKENPYFTDKLLIKTYNLDDEGLTGTSGCQINWKAGKNLTVKILKKKTGRGTGKKGGRQAELKTETKVQQLPSFFNFFAPPAFPEDIDAAGDSLANAIEEDLRLGEVFRDELIPNAVRFFLNEVEQEEGESEYDDEDDDDESEDDDDEDDEDDEDDDEEDSDEEEEAPALKGKKKSLKDKAGGKEQPADCKQQ